MEETSGMFLLPLHENSMAAQKNSITIFLIPQIKEKK
jgi:hypothetical protein